MKLVLASSSKYRRAQLDQIGAVFDFISPDFDEEANKNLQLEPSVLAEELAFGKAESLSKSYPRDAILGGDQLVAFEGQVLGKPGTKTAAVDQLQMMAGKSHRLVTSVCLIVGEKVYRHTDITEMHMRPLSREQLRAYVEYDNPVDCAGSYKLECAGMGLFERIHSDDFSAIQGLPLITLSRWFAELKLESTAFGHF